MPLGKITLVRQSKEAQREWAAEDSGRASLERYVNTHYREEAKKPGKGRKRGCFHPSGLTSCRRAQQFDILYAPKNRVSFPPKILRIFANGHGAEARIRASILEGVKLAGATWEPSVQVRDDEYLIAGEADGVLTTEQKTKWVTDIKTINTKNFSALVRPPESYIWQLHGYMRGLRIPQALLYYENKNNQETKEVAVRWSNSTWQKIHNVIEYVLHHTHRKKLVPMDVELCTKAQCSFHSICFSNPTFDEVDQRPPHKRKLPVLGR